MNEQKLSFQVLNSIFLTLALVGCTYAGSSGTTLFNPVIGNWEMIDPDGTIVTFAISENPDGTFHVEFRDSGVDTCGFANDGETYLALNGSVDGRPDGNILSFHNWDGTCEETEIQLSLDNRFTYNSETDALQDDFGAVYHRQDGPGTIEIDASPFSASQGSSCNLRAVGLTSPIPIHEPAVTVSFDQKPYEMFFDPPSDMAFYFEGQIGFGNQFAETEVDGDCYEVGFDDGEKVMWIEYQSPARVVVRFRGALKNSRGEVAHTDIESDSPYGPGDWADEWFYIYPDGISVRKVQIYTGLAQDAVAFWGRNGTVFETQETTIFQLDPNRLPADDISINALTLVNMKGESKDISFDPYPPEHLDLFAGANIHILNLTNGSNHFTIVPEGDVEIKTYGDNYFETYTQDPGLDFGYSIELSHIINWDWYKQTDNTLQQIYLTGMMTDKSETEKIDFAYKMAKAWQNAPQLVIAEGNFKLSDYLMEEKAYAIEKTTNDVENFRFTLEAGVENPVINPAFIFRDAAGMEIRQVKINDSATSEYCTGYEGSDLILSMLYSTEQEVEFELIFGDNS